SREETDALDVTGRVVFSGRARWRRGNRHDVADLRPPAVASDVVTVLGGAHVFPGQPLRGRLAPVADLRRGKEPRQVAAKIGKNRSTLQLRAAVRLDDGSVRVHLYTFIRSSERRRRMALRATADRRDANKGKVELSHGNHSSQGVARAP